jgi:hypothetical protein
MRLLGSHEGRRLRRSRTLLLPFVAMLTLTSGAMTPAASADTPSSSSAATTHGGHADDAAVRDGVAVPRSVTLVVHGAEGVVDVLGSVTSSRVGVSVSSWSPAAHGMVACNTTGRCHYRAIRSFRGMDAFGVIVVERGRSRPVRVAVRADQAAPRAAARSRRLTTSSLTSSVVAVGAISGSVTVPSGSAGDVCVNASNDSGVVGAAVTPGAPSTSGTYTISGLAPGSYVVQFNACSSSVNLVSQYWQHATSYESATPVAVTSGATTTGINATMAAGATISGAVTVPSGAASDVCVNAFGDAGGGHASVTSGNPVTSGTYSITGLAPGSYIVQFSGCSPSVNLVRQYWQNTTNFDAATPVIVSSGTTTGINATMVTGGGISGTVTVPSGAGFSASDVCVSAFSGNTGAFSSVTDGAPVTTGTFSMTGLPAGSYTVQFNACSPSVNLVTQYWQHTVHYSSATPVVVTAGTTASGINASMAAGGLITGKVSVPTGSASDVCVTALDNDISAYANVATSDPVTLGTYVLNGLPAGAYTVEFRACSPSVNLVPQYWQDTPDFQQATPVTVTAGATAPEINATMAAGGGISGSVSVPAGTVSDVCVVATSGNVYGFASVVPGGSAQSGTYAMIGLAAGSYTVYFFGCGPGASVLPQYWQNTTDLAAATPVSVSAGATTSGINAIMAAGGSLSGTVTVPTGSAGDVCVFAYGSTGFGNASVLEGSSNTGTYVIGSLPTGSYTVQFAGCSTSTNLVTRYWQGTVDPSLSTPVPVTAGSDMPGIDATMTAGGSISGAITLPAGDSASVCVQATGSNNTFGQAFVSGVAGAAVPYVVTGLPAGSYTVAFQPCASSVNLMSQYWQATTNRSAATPVNVTVGATTSGINATMAPGGSISGSVTVPSGTAADVCIAAFTADDNDVGFSSAEAGVPATTGSYVITGLSPGSYTVKFTACSTSANLAPQYWQGAANEASSTPVAVTAGNTATGINATMTQGGSITGTVTVPSGSAGDVCVDVNNATAAAGIGVSVGTPITSGTYRLTGLPAGSYTVEFHPCTAGANLSTQYWNGASTAGSATPVSVTTGGTSAGINATLSLLPGTSITVGSSTNPVVALQQLTFTAHITYTGAAPTGTVTFLDGPLVVGTASPVSGTATFSTPALAPGAHSIMARYLGDSTHNGSVSSAIAQQVNFTDVPNGAPFYADIYWLTDHKITTGFADGSFRPGNPVTRQAFAAYLYRYANGGADAGPCAAGTSPFTDVPDSSQFCGDIAWLVGTGIVQGFSDGTFRPANAVARQAIAAFLYRLNHGGADAGQCAAGTSAFTDVADSNQFCGDIKWLATTSPQAITTGFGDGTFHPAASATRQAVAAYFHRYDTDFGPPAP